MSRRKHVADIICQICGQEIDENEYMIISLNDEGKTVFKHSICEWGDILNKSERANKRNGKKIIDDEKGQPPI